jgi:hypothetical protein
MNSSRTTAAKRNQATNDDQQAKFGKRSTRTIQTSGKSSAVKVEKQVIPTHEQISERAKAIWQQRGCVQGEDERNWYEAENQLMKQGLNID